MLYVYNYTPQNSFKTVMSETLCYVYLNHQDRTNTMPLCDSPSFSSTEKNIIATVFLLKKTHRQ